MPLESLLKLAETLKERVSDHRAALSANEIRTRYALIDPLLRELGWDTSDPSAVIPEYKTRQGGIADYALLKADSPAVMVEAKKLGTPLRDDVLSQVLNYCMMEGTEHFSVTNGARWEIYETHKPVPIDQKLVAEFDLSEDSPASFCLKALALWRPSVEDGFVAPAQTPAIGLDKPAVVPPQPIDPPDPPGDWHRLTDIKTTANRKPSEMLFPDNTRAELRIWIELVAETARWLSQNGHLTLTDSPIKSSPRTKSYILSVSPIHGDGKDFKRGSRKVNGFWIDWNTKAGSIAHLNNTVTVIEHVGQDPSQFRVRFA